MFQIWPALLQYLLSNLGKIDRNIAQISLRQLMNPFLVKVDLNFVILKFWIVFLEPFFKEKLKNNSLNSVPLAFYNFRLHLKGILGDQNMVRASIQYNLGSVYTWTQTVLLLLRDIHDVSNVFFNQCAALIAYKQI
jgi:hypothetical protein